jgi:DNA-binding XRE family transcriptional regulator
VESACIDPGMTMARRIADIFDKDIDEVFERYSFSGWK